MFGRGASLKQGGSLVRCGVFTTLVALTVVAEAKGVAPRGPTGTSDSAESAAPAPGHTLLQRSSHPLARSAADIGRLDPKKRLSHISVVFKLTPQQETERDALINDLGNPSSPSYHKWLTPEEYAARFGAKPEDSARVASWLTSQGLDVQFTSRLASRVTFSGAVAQVESAFKTEMHRYNVGGQVHYAMASAPSMPAELADLVMGLHNTHDFTPRPVVEHATKKPVPATACPSGDLLCKGNGLAPPDWANIYDVTSLYSASSGINGTAIDGTGVTIAVVGVADVAQSDITAFRTAYGLAANPITKTLVPGTGTAAPGSQGSGIEAILDLEWTGGIAKNATINYVYVGQDVPNVEVGTYWAIEQNLAPIISESWGGCELGYTVADANIAQVYGAAAALLGITYVAAAGDTGAASCLDFGVPGVYVNIPAAYPGVTAVGGTQFASGSLTFSGPSGVQTGYPTGGSSEDAWNESDNPNSQNGVGAGGGGISMLFPRPSYQSGIAQCTPVGKLPGGASPANMRQVPDVAFAAAQGLPGYFVACSVSIAAQDCSASGGTPTTLMIGGTSAATPAFAGVVALLNQATGGRLGNINPMLYQLAATNPVAFHDVTVGNNEIECSPGTDDGCPAGGLYGYAAGTGYDCATGLGSMDVAAVVKAWAGLGATTTTLAANPTSTSEGAAVNLTAAVAPKSGGAPVSNGTVTFAFESYAANGTLDLSWAVGSATVSGGAATLSTAIPPGMVNPSAQYVDVVAEYGGDSTHLASTSPKERITFSPVTLCVSPGVRSVAPGATVTYSSSGGSGGVQWLINSDTACLPDGGSCSWLDGGTLMTTSAPSWILVQAVDSQGAETWAELTVGSPGGGPSPWEGDSGVLASSLACDGPGGDAPTTSSSGGCHCTVGPTNSAPPAGLFAGVLLGLGLIVRRRRSAND